MTLRVAIPLLAICLASPAITGAEQAKKGRGYSPRGESGGGQAATRSGGDSNRGSGDTSRSGGDRTATSNSRPAERRAESRAPERTEERRTSRTSDASDEGRAERPSDRDDGQRYAVPRDNGRRNTRPVIVTRGRPPININIGSRYGSQRYYAPVHYDYWARRYYRWSPIGYAPWSLIYGSIGYSNFGYYGGMGPSPYSYGYGGYGPGSTVYVPGGYDLGGIRLDVRPRDAQVWVDGYYAGVVDEFDGLFQSLRLEAGGHKIEVRMPGFDDFALDVHVQPGRKFTIRADLQPRP
jgi:hypothetical protein